jgi:transposase InsO family protein
MVINGFSRPQITSRSGLNLYQPRGPQIRLSWIFWKRISSLILECQQISLYDNAKAFISLELATFCFNYGIVLSHSSNYYPQGNGLVESSNKNLMTIIKKTMGDNKKSWDRKIKYALWADRITKKDSIGNIPFDLVYGMDVTFPFHLKILIYKLMQQFSSNQDAMQNRINQLIELDENQRHAFDHLAKSQEKMKTKF